MLHTSILCLNSLLFRYIRPSQYFLMMNEEEDDGSDDEEVDSVSLYFTGPAGPAGGHDGRCQRGAGGTEPQLRHTGNRRG